MAEGHRGVGPGRLLPGLGTVWGRARTCAVPGATGVRHRASTRGYPFEPSPNQRQLGGAELG